MTTDNATLTGPSLEETDTDLLVALRDLFDRYGPLGVIRTAIEFGIRVPTGPSLGLATTSQLLDEIASRIATDYASGGGGLDYTTVRGRPDALSVDPGPREPRVGDMVRVDNDRGFGIKGAISQVYRLDGMWRVITVGDQSYAVLPEDVTVVTYDNVTRQWNEVTA